MKMKKKHVSIFLILFVAMPMLFLGQNSTRLSDYSTWNTELRGIATPDIYPNSIFLDTSKHIAGDSIFFYYKEDFGLSDKDSMILTRVDTCELGQIHYRYQQYYGGILIEGAQYIVHATKDNHAIKSNGQIVYLSGNFPHTINDTLWIIDMISEKYPTFSISSPLDLVFTRTSDNLDVSEDYIVLSVKVELTDTSSMLPERVIAYFDFNKQAFIKNYNERIGGIGNCLTLYNGWQSITTKWTGSITKWKLLDETRGRIRTAINCNPSYLFCSLVNDDDNNWSSIEERGATSAHWAVGVSWDYFKKTFGRRGMNNNNGRIDIIASITANLNTMPNNAFFQYNRTGPDLLCFGAGDNVNARDFAALDVVAHEFTHGVTKYSADLIYSHESGALNESFSDIFGTLIEFSIEGSNGNYEIGEDVAINPKFKRSLMQPKSYPTSLTEGSPNTYNGTYWYTGTGDRGGVHINNGVQNHWFYLLAEGGNGLNDHNHSYSVQGIGRDKAARIAYRNLTNYLTSSSNYSSAMMSSIWAAEDLYGECSFEVQQVIKAWDAVGISIPSLKYCGNLVGNNFSRSFAAIVFAPNNCPTTIKNGSNMRYQSHSYIELLSGFEVEAGASFEADTYECN